MSSRYFSRLVVREHVHLPRSGHILTDNIQPKSESLQVLILLDFSGAAEGPLYRDIKVSQIGTPVAQRTPRNPCLRAMRVTRGGGPTPIRRGVEMARAL